MGRRPDPAMWRRLVEVAPSGDASLQIQIRRCLAAAILDGRLPAGCALPSSRALATLLKVSRNTVALAYRQMVDEGFVIPRERRGYFVHDQPAVPAARRPLPAAAGTPRAPSWLERLSGRLSSGQRNIRKPADWQRYPFPFVYGQSDPLLFPVAEWRECSRSALGVREIRDWSADMIDGDDPLLVEQLRSRVLPRRGIWAAASQIMITVGAQHALFLLAALLAAPERTVGVEDPGYPDARNIFALHGATLRPLGVAPEGHLAEHALAGCDYLYLTPSHQCPMTTTMPLADRETLLDRARGEDIVLIEDDYESELSFHDEPTAALKSLDREGRVVYVGSLSKTLAPGLRLGYIVGSEELIFEARALRRLMLRHPPANNQRATALFLQLGHHDALLRRLVRTFRERAEILAAALSRHLPGLRFRAPTGGSSLWVQGPAGFDGRRLADAAERAGVLLEPGDVFFSAPPTPCPFFRLGFSSIRAEAIEPGVRRLARVIAEDLC